MADFETRESRRDWRCARRADRHSRHGHIWTGVFLLIIGGAALMKSLLFPIPDWLFSWQMLLILLGFFIGIRHRFSGSAWFILILIGGAFLLNDYILEGDLHRHIWPIVLMAMGLFFIFSPRRRHRFDWQANLDQKTRDAVSGQNWEEKNFSQEDFIDATSIFGGVKKNILSKDFKGGDITNIFGGTDLNLTQADIHGTVLLDITTLFGGTKLIIPANWTVKSEVVTVFGGIEDKRPIQSILDNPDKVLLLKGTVIFGGIDIKN
ncbi:MAG TPA: LiaF domain-containing protein [Chitinophagaceae bacterium]|jgi:predicted membrane protein|nr:LiaF domain-containing protein [Chitinophagaceae bacterium]